MTDSRDYSRNLGLISLNEIPDDKWIAGAIIVLLDKDGNYTTVFKAQSLEHLPAPEIQEEIRSIVTHSWAVANVTGFE